ncbi:MAG: hypothetical protein ACFN9G_03480 [Cardiobacterium sp.]
MNVCNPVRLALLMALASATPFSSALQAGTFTQYPLRPTTAAAGMQLTRLAVLDASPQSRQWLRDNAAYLTAQQIPVMVLHSSPADSAALLADYQGSGLLLGVAPEPPELMDAVLQRLGVELYPAVIEDGMVWQLRDASVQRPPRTTPETITIPSPEKPQPPLSEEADSAPSAEAVALQRELEAMRQESAAGGAAASVPGTAGAGVTTPGTGRAGIFTPGTGTGAMQPPVTGSGSVPAGGENHSGNP